MKHLSLKERLISVFHRKKNKQRKKQPDTIDFDTSDESFSDIEERLLEWVDEKLFSDESIRSVGDIADSIGIRRHSLSRYFAIVLKEDPRTWIVQCRIDMAKEMLIRYPDCSTTIIGDSVGFSDRSNFARQFKKHTGMTPREWRERKLVNSGEKSVYTFNLENM